MTTPGQLVILNGPPRSGKSSIAAAIQNSFEGVWMNLGVDRFMAMTPKRATSTELACALAVNAPISSHLSSFSTARCTNPLLRTVALG
jgi:chloramphenicol 3-O-phosphotransferase